MQYFKMPSDIIQLSNYVETAFMHITQWSEKQIYLTSDRHLLHKNILEYDKLRPFNNLEDHTDYIINSINELDKDTILLFLWDLWLWNADKIREIVSRITLNHKYWILGNHDLPNLVRKCSDLFSIVCQELWINDRIYCCHLPPIDYNWIENYKILNNKYYIHWHTHKSNWCVNNRILDVSYNGKQLIYKLTNYINA